MAKDVRIQKMRQEFQDLRQAIASDLDERFHSSERRLRDGLSKDLDTKLDARDKRLRDGLSKDLRDGLSKDLDERFAASEQRLTEKLTHVIVQQLETAQQHLEGRLQVHMEDMKGLLTTTAEAYGGTLDGIERKLGELNQKMETKVSDHDKALADHGERLVTLERVRRRAPRA
jgi:exonuclease VII large subunit